MDNEKLMRFEKLKIVMDGKLELIAEYIRYGMDSSAMLELTSMKDYLELQMSEIVELCKTN